MVEITDAAVKAAVAAVSDEVCWVSGLFGGKYDNAEEVMRDALEAALASPAEPSAYQWRMKHPAMADWSEWREGRANFSEDCGFLFEERSLYAHPPQQEPARLREALQAMVDVYADMQDGDGNPCPTVAGARAALAEDGL